MIHKRKILIAGLAIWSAVTQAQSDRIGFFASLEERHPFWVSVGQFERHVGENLGIESVWLYAESDHFRAREQIEQAATSATPIRAAVVSDFNGRGPELLEFATSFNLPVLTFAGFDVRPDFQPRAGNPRWIGAISMDEEAVGYSTAVTLLLEAQRLKLFDVDGRVHIVGIAGDVRSVLSRQRVAGLRRAVAETHGRAILEQVVPTDDWSQVQGRQKARGLMKRYPGTTLIWSANDAIALGALQAMQDRKRTPGVDVLTYGIDWVPAAIKAIQNEQMLCSAGGLAFQAGWAAILLYDYLHGRDFIDDTGSVIKIPHGLITRSNVDRFAAVNDWQHIDFSSFSKVRNPKRVRYDFSIEAVLRAAK